MLRDRNVRSLIDKYESLATFESRTKVKVSNVSHLITHLSAESNYGSNNELASLGRLMLCVFSFNGLTLKS